MVPDHRRHPPRPRGQRRSGHDGGQRHPRHQRCTDLAPPRDVAARARVGRLRQGRSSGELLAGPLVARVDADLDGRYGYRRVLDMRTGVLREERHGPDGTGAALRFVSAVRPASWPSGSRTTASDGTARRPRTPRVVSRPSSAPPDCASRPRREDRALRGRARSGRALGPGRRRRRCRGHRRRRQRHVGARSSPTHPRATSRDARRPAPRRRALEGLAAANAAGFDRLLSEHRSEWARRWADANIVIEGDPALDFAVRLKPLPPDGVGRGPRRGRGRSPWPVRSRVPRPRVLGRRLFGLPFFAATRPDAARACSSTGSVASGRARGGRRPRARRRAVPVGVGAHRARGDTAVVSRRGGAPGPDPHGRRRGAHRRRRRVGRVLLRRLDGRRRVRRRTRRAAPRRVGALLGEPDPRRPSRRRARLRCHRTGRVPRAGRRRRVHET